MKKTLLIIVIMFALAGMAKAQNVPNDNFFVNMEEMDNRVGDYDDLFNPIVPGGHGANGDISAPLGSGLLLLTALGAGYALSRKQRKH